MEALGTQPSTNDLDLDEPIDGDSSRDAHKRRTRSALRAAAMELFLERGFDGATTEEVAERAGVSARTFFRYFPTKESILYRSEQSWPEVFTELYARQPAHLSEVEALRSALCQLAGTLPRSHAAALLHEQIVTQSAVLRGRQLEYQIDTARRLARTLAERRGSDDVDAQARLLGAMGVMIYRESLDAWLAGPATVSFASVVADYFDLMRQQLA